MSNKVIIDTDIGTYYDDALAVMHGAKVPELDVLGVTTVYGDTDLRAQIGRKVLDVAGREDVPVCAGVGTPMSPEHDEALMFGFEGENVLEEDEEPEYSDEHAVDFIIRQVKENPGEVSVVTLGAVSNVALAYLKEPSIAEDMKELISMAGVVNTIVDEEGVRRSPVEEYNFNNDPVAAQIVCESDMPFTLVPIDVTLQVPLEDEFRDRVADATNPVANQIDDILEVWPEQERQIYMQVGIPTEHTGLWLHDSLALALVYEPDFCTITPLHIEATFAETPVPRDMVVREDVLRTIPRKREPNMDVAVEVEAERFKDHFTSVVTDEYGA